MSAYTTQIRRGLMRDVIARPSIIAEWLVVDVIASTRDELTRIRRETYWDELSEGGKLRFVNDARAMRIRAVGGVGRGGVML